MDRLGDKDKGADGCPALRLHTKSKQVLWLIIGICESLHSKWKTKFGSKNMKLKGPTKKYIRSINVFCIY